MPEVSDYDNQDDWMAACVPARVDEGDEQDQAVAVCIDIWENRGKTMEKEPEAIHVVFTESEEVFRYPPRREGSDNALKTLSRTPAEIRVANYIVLFGGRDLEGLEPGTTNVAWKNPDGSRGEFFTPDTVLESAYTKTGTLYLDWEHGMDRAKGAPGRDDPVGYVDWKTAKADDRGVWVERALNRHNEYVKWLEELIDAGIVGTSSAAIPSKVQKADSGAILAWPLERDTLTVTPMEWRNKAENVVQALKALGLHNEPEAEPEGTQVSASVTDSVEYHQWWSIINQIHNRR
jgi:hypothetical protein